MTDAKLWAALQRLDDDFLDPAMPEELVDEALCELGIDPAALAYAALRIDRTATAAYGGGMTNPKAWQYLIYTALPKGPRVIIAPPEGGWTLELVERWLETAKHAPRSTIFIDRRPAGGGTGPFPGTSAPFLEWRAYQIDAKGVLRRIDGGSQG